jgi:hypothetical protein
MMSALWTWGPVVWGRWWIGVDSIGSRVVGGRS